MRMLVSSTKTLSKWSIRDSFFKSLQKLVLGSKVVFLSSVGKRSRCHNVERIRDFFCAPVFSPHFESEIGGLLRRWGRSSSCGKRIFCVVENTMWDSLESYMPVECLFVKAEYYHHGKTRHLLGRGFSILNWAPRHSVIMVVFLWKNPWNPFWKHFKCN